MLSRLLKILRTRNWAQLDAVAYVVVFAGILVFAAIASIVSRFSN